MKLSKFSFKHFDIIREKAAMKLTTDAVLLGAWCVNCLTQVNDDDTNSKIEDILSVNKCLKVYKALDIGTGTGILSLILAQYLPNSNIMAIDIDENALIDAQKNFENSPWSDRLSIRNVSLEKYSNECSSELNKNSDLYDLIICNPPYFDFSVKYVDIGRMRARCNESMTPQSLFCNSNNLLKDNSSLFLIIPFEQLERYLEFAKQYNFVINKVLNVSSVKGKNPYVSLIWFIKEQFLSIAKTQSSDLNNYSQVSEYLFLESGTQKSDFWKNLTKELYIK
jgi:tRNA1Val (adenine37-N6)-methyltransferase